MSNTKDEPNLSNFWMPFTANRQFHGVGFGGIPVDGIVANRKAFSGGLIPYVDHLPHTHNLAETAFTRGSTFDRRRSTDRSDLHDGTGCASPRRMKSNGPQRSAR